MEQTDACECHCHLILVASRNNMVVTDTATSLSYILYTTLVCTFDVIAEGEECI